MGPPPSPAQATRASLGGTGLSGNPPITPNLLDWKQRSQDPEEEEPVSVLRAGPVGEPPAPKGTPVLMTVLVGSLYPPSGGQQCVLAVKAHTVGELRGPNHSPVPGPLLAHSGTPQGPREKSEQSRKGASSGWKLALGRAGATMGLKPMMSPPCP